MVAATFIFALSFSLIHVFADSLRIRDERTHRYFHSVAGGISVSYVFIHLLPQIGAGKTAFERMSISNSSGFMENYPYLIALVGLIIFYGLEKSARFSRKRRVSQNQEDVCSRGVFSIHITTFFIFNLFIGYLLHQRFEHRFINLILYFIAMGLHFFIIDHWMHHNHRERYHQIGRWILAFAALMGWALGMLMELDESILSLIFAFLMGGVVMNVLKEELPYDKEHNFWPFALAAAIFSVLLLAA